VPNPKGDWNVKFTSARLDFRARVEAYAASVGHPGTWGDVIADLAGAQLDRCEVWDKTAVIVHDQPPVDLAARALERYDRVYHSPELRYKRPTKLVYQRLIAASDADFSALIQQLIDGPVDPEQWAVDHPSGEV
jgi:hypothetical protein